MLFFNTFSRSVHIFNMPFLWSHSWTLAVNQRSGKKTSWPQIRLPNAFRHRSQSESIGLGQFPASVWPTFPLDRVRPFHPHLRTCPKSQNKLKRYWTRYGRYEICDVLCCFQNMTYHSILRIWNQLFGSWLPCMTISRM